MDVNSKKTDRNYMLITPLDFAVEGGHDECVAFLRNHGALTFKELKLGARLSFAG